MIRKIASELTILNYIDTLRKTGNIIKKQAVLFK